MSWLPDIITLILGLLAGIGVTWNIAASRGRRDGQREVETETEVRTLRNHVETRERIDEADRKPLDGDDARIWLRVFSAGGRSGPKR